MKGKRVALLTLFVAALAAVAIEPAAAQSADTTTERLIWDLNNQLLYIAVPITVLVEAILFYTVWKYRNNESPLPTKENRLREHLVGGDADEQQDDGRRDGPGDLETAVLFRRERRLVVPVLPDGVEEDRLDE